MAIRFGNQNHRPIEDSEFLPTPEFQESLDHRNQKLDHFGRMTKRFGEHNNPVYCRCEFCRVYRETL